MTLNGLFLIFILLLILSSYGRRTDNGNVENGKKLFIRLASTVHFLKKDVNLVGPSLYCILGKRAGITLGYNYSDSLKLSGITWNKEILDRF